MLFNEPKLLKSERVGGAVGDPRVSVLFNEPKLLKFERRTGICGAAERVSVLFNEPKLLKLRCWLRWRRSSARFSALQRAEIAEITLVMPLILVPTEFQCSSTSRNC